MTLRELIPLIEAPLFSAEVNLASGSKGFYQTLRRHPLVKALREQLCSHDVATALVRRVHQLSKVETDEGYENPYDAAMTAYLTALEDTNRDLAAAAARSVAKLENCWWAAETSARLRPIEPVFIYSTPSEVIEIPSHLIIGGTSTETYEEPARKGTPFNFAPVRLVGAVA